MPETALREPTYRCEWCGTDGLHEGDIVAARTPHGAVMMCEHCAPEPPGVNDVEGK